MQDRGRIGQPGRFNQNPSELSLACPRKTPGNVAQGLYQIAPYGAAQATTTHGLDYIFLAMRHQMMVQRRLPKLIDDDQGVGHLRFLQSAVQQGGLATA